MKFCFHLSGTELAPLLIIYFRKKPKVKINEKILAGSKKLSALFFCMFLSDTAVLLVTTVFFTMHNPLKTVHYIILSNGILKLNS